MLKRRKKKRQQLYACYLLCSLSVKGKGRTYVGFTVNPRRRIRQHNGELTMGACSTRAFRPWDMVLVVYGFSNQGAYIVANTHTVFFSLSLSSGQDSDRKQKTLILKYCAFFDYFYFFFFFWVGCLGLKGRALAFEWAWQHPQRSTIIRDKICLMKKSQLSGVKGKARILKELLAAEKFKGEPLRVQVLDSKYSSSVLPFLEAVREDVPIEIAPMEELPQSAPAANDAGDGDEDDDDDLQLSGCIAAREVLAAPPGSIKCMICFEKLIDGCVALRCRCSSWFHPMCLEKQFASYSSKASTELELDRGKCPLCDYELTWKEALDLGRNFSIVSSFSVGDAKEEEDLETNKEEDEDDDEMVIMPLRQRLQARDADISQQKEEEATKRSITLPPRSPLSPVVISLLSPEKEEAKENVISDQDDSCVMVLD